MVVDGSAVVDGTVMIDGSVIVEGRKLVDGCLVDQYYSILSNILGAHAPLITKQAQDRQLPVWLIISNTMQEAKRDRRRAERRWLTERTQGHIDVLQFASAKLNNLCESAKKKSCKAMIAEMGLIRKHCTG